jgi:catechol 2,3-dioxygenase-like lactoylglutathione lyase family enzyme
MALQWKSTLPGESRSGVTPICLPDSPRPLPEDAIASDRADYNRPMQLRIGSIVIHCHQFDRMVDFWQKALGYLPREPASNGWCVLRDPGGKYPNVSFQARKTRRPGRNWIHLDLYTDNQTTEVARLETLGARRYPWRYHVGADFVVLEDPDGNLFCVVQQREHGSQAATNQ